MPQKSKGESVIQIDDIELWLLDRDAHAATLAGIEVGRQLLPSAERERAATKIDRADATRWLNGRIALRLLLERRVGARAARTPFLVNSSGRPVIAGCELDFSLSDSGSMLMIAMSRVGRIGVDSETIRSLKMAPVRVARLVAASNGLVGGRSRQLTDGNVVEAWTRIEAYAKATATSLAGCLSSLGTAGHIGHPTTIGELYEHAERMRIASGVSVHDLALPDGLVGAVVLPVAAVGLKPEVRILNEQRLSNL